MFNLQHAKQDPFMNRNINDPNARTIVRDVATGDLIALASMRDFKPGKHVHVNLAQEPQKSLPAQETVDDLLQDNVVLNINEIDELLEEFKAMKAARAWTKGEESAARYKELKAKLGL